MSRALWARVTALSSLLCATGCGEAPDAPQCTVPAQLVYLDHGPHWDEHARQLYYYTPQGTELHALRYRWLLALERPDGDGLFAEPANLVRYGFLYAPEQLQAGYQPPPYNPGNLPVGFTHHKDTGSGEAMFDIGCAACHTGQLEYQGTALRVDGGPALHALAWSRSGQFAPDLLKALSRTYVQPFAFDRFAERVLGLRYPDGKPALREQLRETLRGFMREAFQTVLPPHALFSSEGYGRIDALSHIADFVLGYRIDPDNNVVGNAPVNYPHLWDIWKFDWVQWNGSAAQPMARNVGEALGVKARLALLDDSGHALPPGEMYASSVLVRELDCVETTLFKLGPPRWDESVLPAIERDRLPRGKALFDTHCRGCHGPHVYGEPTAGATHNPCAVQAGEAQPTRDKPVEWKMCVVDASDIGTDPQLVDNFLDYRYDVSALDPSSPALREIDAGRALDLLTRKVIARLYDEIGALPEQREAMDGWGREIGVRERRGYKARPLHGIWATPPFLHNGSVRTLYELLLPADQREQSFWVGSREFDPTEVGYVDQPVPGAYRFDTTVAGNLNTGHQFADGGPGTIGPPLEHEQRLDIIEYLKVLGNPEFRCVAGPSPQPSDVSSGRPAQAAGECESPSARTVEPWVDAGRWNCPSDIQGPAAFERYLEARR